jgi:hypothetical protein
LLRCCLSHVVLVPEGEVECPELINCLTHPQFRSVVVSRLSFVVVVGDDFGPLMSQASAKEVTPSSQYVVVGKQRC